MMQALLAFTVKELSSHLQKNGFAFNHCDILEGKVLKHLYYIFGHDLRCRPNFLPKFLPCKTGDFTPFFEGI